MLILSHVCVEFHDRKGSAIHRITPDQIGLFHDAPEAIREDLLFDMLVNDGSIKTPESAVKKAELEKDPMKGAAANGKEIRQKPGRPAAEAKADAGTGDAGKK